MNPSQASRSTQFKVGVFSIMCLLLIGMATVLVNDRPFWWRPCQLVHINVDDATGLKTKSAIRSLGLQIGYLHSVELTETYVRLGICITAPVEVLATTRAYIRGEGFLGDKFVELKPIRYIGPKPSIAPTVPVKEGLDTPLTPAKKGAMRESSLEEDTEGGLPVLREVGKVWDLFVPSVYASNPREIPVGQKSQDVQHIVEQVDGLVGEMKKLTNNLQESINPEQLKNTVNQLNKALENAGRTLSPEGSLNTTAQRTLAKLEDAVEQLRDQVTRLNRGEGSVGMVLNDTQYAEQLKEILEKTNKLLGRANQLKVEVDMSVESLNAYSDTRGTGQVWIWTRPDRYYRVGASLDPRGKRSVIETVTEKVDALGVRTVESQKQTIIEESELLFTAQFGKLIKNRYEFSAGILYGDGTVSFAYRLGPEQFEKFASIRTDLYSHSASGLDARVGVTLYPWLKSPLLDSFYFKASLESFEKVNGRMNFGLTAGVSFDDEDVRMLFSFL